MKKQKLIWALGSAIGLITISVAFQNCDQIASNTKFEQTSEADLLTADDDIIKRLTMPAPTLVGKFEYACGDKINLLATTFKSDNILYGCDAKNCYDRLDLLAAEPDLGLVKWK